ncbi:MAG: peptidoglycan binding domain-containing protein, partial [Solirubrobacteraceae bacterium]
MSDRRPGLRPRWGRIGVALATLLALVVLLTAIAVRVLHSGEILPGVHVAGVSLGGVSEDDARRRLGPALRSAEPVTLVAEGRTLQVAPKRAGYVADVDATVADAMDSGRGGPFGGFWSTVAGIFSSRDVPATVKVDRQRLRRAVAVAADRIESRAFAGALVIKPGSLDVRTEPPRAGREVDRDELAARLRAELLRSERKRVEVPLRATPVV